MLAIRMQRTGRKGHAQFRIIVQDSRRTPTSGTIVTQLGHYNPHDKAVVLDKEKAGFYLEHGAQPSDRVARLFKSEGIKLPGWVKLAADKSRIARHPEKLRKNQPAAPAAVQEIAAEESVPEAAAEPAETTTSETEISSPEVASETPVESETEPAAGSETAEPAAAEAEVSKEEADTSSEPAAESNVEPVSEAAAPESEDAPAASPEK